MDNFKIPLPLGAWKAQSHKIREWFMNENDSVLYRSRGDGRHDSYVKSLDRGQKFHLHSVVMEVENLRPVSVRKFVDGSVRIQTKAELVTEERKSSQSFWNFLKEGGGDWMWEFIEDKYKSKDMRWLQEGMLNGTLVWCSDGSYKRKLHQK